MIAAPPEQVFAVLQRLGGRSGWFKYNRLWRLRGWLDRVSRRSWHPAQPQGSRDAVVGRHARLSGGWVEIERPTQLTLRAEMRVPGDAVLGFELQAVDGDASSTRLIQTARFRPRGLAGLAYWYAVAPFHKPVFDGLFAGIARAAKEVK